MYKTVRKIDPRPQVIVIHLIYMLSMFSLFKSNCVNQVPSNSTFTFHQSIFLTVQLYFSLI